MANTTDSILKAQRSTWIPTRASAIKIALCYALAGALWVLCSDWVLHLLVWSAGLHAAIALLKGWLFVGVTAFLLGWALDGYFLSIRRSAQLLRETEERWKQALEGTSQAVWDWNLQSNEVIYSPEWKAMLGYDTHEIANTLAEWETRVHPEDLPSVQEEVKRHLEGQTPTYASEHRLRCRDGSFKWVLHGGRVANRSLNGEPLRMVGTISDIHPRKQAEERSRIQHDLMQALVATNQLDDGLRLCLDAAIRADGLTAGGVHLFDPKNRKLNLRVHTGLSKEFVAAVAQYELESPRGLLVAKGAPVYAEFKELRLNQSEVESREGLQSIAILPILNQGQLLGCLNVASHTHGKIPPSARLSLETIAATAGETIARLQVQDALLESEARYRALFNDAAEGIMILSSDGKELRVNAALARMHGYETPAEMASLGLSDLDTPASAAFAEERVRRVAEGETLTFEVEHYRKDGSTVPLSVTTSRVDLGGKWYLQSFHRDMTEQKRTEEALRQRLDLQDQLAKVAATVPGLICSFKLRPDGSACMPFATPAIKEIYGLRPEDVREDFSPVFAQVHPDDREHLQRSIAESSRTMQPWHDVFRTRHPQKGEVWIEGHSVPRLEADGSILWHGFVQDVTARRRAETALQESERRLATLLANLPGMAYRCQNTVDWPMVFVSEGCAALTGHSSTDLSTSKPAYGDLIVVEDRQSVWDGVKQALAERRSFELTYRIQSADGHIKWVWERGRGVFSEEGGVLFLEGFITDISERKRLEQERESALVKYRTLFDAFPLGITVADPRGRITESNRQAQEILGFSADEYLTRQIGGAEWNIVRPDGTPMPGEEFASVRALQNRCLVENVEMGLVKSPTETTWITATAAPVPLPDVGVVIAFSDISVRKRTEAALLASELKYRVVANNTFDWEFWLSPEGRFLYTSPSCERITGRKPAEFEADPELFLRIVHPDDLPHFQSHHAASLSGCQEEEQEFRVLRPNGEVRWIGHVCTPICDEAGRFLGVRGSNRDITERKRAEAALRESERLLRQMGCMAKVGGWEFDVTTGSGGWTEEVARIHDLDPELKPSRELGLSFYHGESASRISAAVENAVAHGVPYDLELEFVSAKGTRKWVHTIGQPVVENDRVIRLHGAIQDITERKQAEEALRQSEAEFRSMFEVASIGMAQTDPKTGQFLRVNEKFCAITGYSSDEMLGMSVTKLTHPDDRERDWDLFQSVVRGDTADSRVEQRYLRKDSQVIWVNVNMTLLRDARGQPLRTMATIEEITHRKRTEAHAAREALRTEFLLELHQRAPQLTDRELYDYVLERAVKLTESAIGFFHQVSEDQRSIILTTWNQEALKNCTAVHDSHYALKDAGNWVDCVRQQRPVVYNDYADSPNRRGLPAGHAPVRRFMSMPVLWEGKVRIIFGVGNKPTDYDDDDVAQLQVVANELHKLMMQRAAQNQLRQLSRVVEQSPVSVVITDTTGAIEYVNPKFTQISGYRLQEVRGQTPRVLKSGKTPPEQYRQLWQTILAGKEWRGEFHNRKRNGELHWESASISPITDPSGKITHFVAVKEDITHRKRLESFRQALLSLGHQLNGTRDATGAGRALLKAADRLWQWDSATLNILTPDRKRSHSVLQVDTIAGKRQELPAGREGSLTPRMQKVMREGAFLILRDNRSPCVTDSVPFGDTTRLSASIMCVPIRRELEIVGILSIQSYTPEAYTNDDLNVLQALADYCGGALERIDMEEAHHRAEERYRNLVETTYDWVWEVDVKGCYTYASPKVEDLLGYLPAEVLGKTPFDFMAEDDALRLRSIFNETASRRKPFAALEHTNRHKDGRLVTLETNGVPVFGENGKWLGYRGMDRDVSERRRLELQLRQAQKLEAIGQLAGGVAHDFNNILAAIMMHLGLLQMNRSLDQETLQALKELDEESRRAASLTRQLLMFSRRSVLAVKPLDLNEVIANLLKMLSRLIGENVNLVFAGGTALPFVEADAGMLEQILMNLVVNARDAMPRGGRITISTSLEVMGNREVALDSNRRQGRFVCLTVSDTGTGMDEATLKRIFEPFFTTKEAGKGTGLGLATVYGIVAQHNGWLEVESTVGQGTIFRVFLPAREETVKKTEQPPPREPLLRGKETILLVEDEAKVRHTVGQTLRILGYRVYEAANGQEAMVLWQAHGAQVDLLFTDMVMPEGMTGLELTERLQTLRPDLKAIISSGYSAEIVQAGVSDKAGVLYLPKPYTAQTLAEAVRNCLDQKTHRK